MDVIIDNVDTETDEEIWVVWTSLKVESSIVTVVHCSLVMLCVDMTGSKSVIVFSLGYRGYR